MPADRALGMMARLPRPGAVKTRLAARIGGDAAAETYAGFIGAQMEAHRGRPYDFRVFLDPFEPDEFRRRFGDAAISPQAGGDLGERMRRALELLLEEHERAALIGSDLPTLSARRVEEAFAALEDHDAVLGPSEDGGYYLVAMRRIEPVFDDMPWGTPAVFETTLARLRGAGRRAAVLPVERDIDTWEDLYAHLVDRHRP